MCDIKEEIFKLAMMAGQIEHDLCQLMARTRRKKTVGYQEELKPVAARITARGDLWAIECYNRALSKLEENGDHLDMWAQVDEESSPGETVNEALKKASNLLS